MVRRTVASVEPRATVTTRSNAFIFDSVRFPESRRNATNVTYASTPTTRVRNKLCHPLNSYCSKTTSAVCRSVSRGLAVATF